MAKTVNETLDFGTVARIRHLPAATSGDEPVRKSEFDASLAARDYIEQPARVAVTTNISVTVAPANPYDGVALTSGVDRLLLTAQTNNHENGLYTFQGAGNPLARTADTYEAGTVVMVGPDGTANKNTAWLQTTDSPVVGTTALTFTQFGTSISAGTGLTLTGNTISLTTPVTVANGGTGAGSASGARANLSAAGVFSATFGDGAATTFTINHNLGNEYCAVVVTNLTTNQDEDCTVTRNSGNQLVLSSEAWAATPPAANAYKVSCIG